MAASVFVVHAVLLWIALERRAAQSPPDPAAQVLVVASMFETPPALANVPDPAPLDRPRLQDFVPQEFVTEPVEIQVPEAPVSESPMVVAAESPGAPAVGPRRMRAIVPSGPTTGPVCSTPRARRVSRAGSSGPTV